MKRRQFIGTTASAITFLPLAGCAASFGGTKREGYLIKGSTLYDGMGGDPFVADIRIANGRIAEIGQDLNSAAGFVIDGRGLSVSPGFIDIHSHTDLSLFVNPNAESKIRQGVTTEVVGQDGSSVGPWTEDEAESRSKFYQEEFGVELNFKTLPEFMDAIDSLGPSVNVASMIGSGTVRGYVVGDDDVPASAEQVNEMVQIVEEAVAAGACGVSSGLEYIPNAFSRTDELISLCRPLQVKGLPYATHMRNEDDGVLGALEEAIHIARMAGVPLQVSHLKAQGKRNWWKADYLLQLMETAASDGLDVTFDRYPYTAYSTGLASLFPQWARAGGTNAFLARLESDDGRIRTEVEEKIKKLGDWDSVQISGIYNDDLLWAQGQRLGQLAKSRGVEPYELLSELTFGDRNRTDIVGFGMSEPNTAKLLAHPLGMICSDGGARATYGALSNDVPHPRTFGAFPRLLGHYVRENKILNLNDAIRKMTGMPAEKLGLRDRGRLQPGLAADLVVFDHEKIADEATFDDPHRYASGVNFVFVNGEMAVEGEDHHNSRSGRMLRA